MDKETEFLFQAIDVFFKHKLNSLPFDQSKYGRVVEKTGNSYKVKIHDEEHNIKSKFDFNVGERVLVLFPQGRSKDLYIYPNEI